MITVFVIIILLPTALRLTFRCGAQKSTRIFGIELQWNEKAIFFPESAQHLCSGSRGGVYCLGVRCLYLIFAVQLSLLICYTYHH